jgi:hypothetical protein
VVIGPEEMLGAGRGVQEVAQVIWVDLGKEGIEEDKDKESRQVTRTIESQTVFFEPSPG